MQKKCMSQIKKEILCIECLDSVGACWQCDRRFSYKGKCTDCEKEFNYE